MLTGSVQLYSRIWLILLLIHLTLTLEKNAGLWLVETSRRRFFSRFCRMERTSAADRPDFRDSSADTWASLRRNDTEECWWSHWLVTGFREQKWDKWRRSQVTWLLSVSPQTPEPTADTPAVSHGNQVVLTADLGHIVREKTRRRQNIKPKTHTEKYVHSVKNMLRPDRVTPTRN